MCVQQEQSFEAHTSGRCFQADRASAPEPGDLGLGPGSGVTLDRSLPTSGLQFPYLSEGEGWGHRAGSSCSAAVDSGIVSELRALNEFCCMSLGTSRVPDLGGAYTEAWKPALPRR